MRRTLALDVHSEAVFHGENNEYRTSQGVSMNLNAYAIECHAANDKWWRDITTGERKERNVGELLMLCVSELAEAMEGHRKGLPDDKLPPSVNVRG